MTRTRSSSAQRPPASIHEAAVFNDIGRPRFNMRRSLSRGKLNLHRVSDEFHSRDSRAWLITRQVILFSLSFAIALNLCVKVRTAHHSSHRQQQGLEQAEPGSIWTQSDLDTSRQHAGRRTFAAIRATPRRTHRSDSGGRTNFPAADFPDYI